MAFWAAALVATRSPSAASRSRCCWSSLSGLAAAPYGGQVTKTKLGGLRPISAFTLRGSRLCPRTDFTLLPCPPPKLSTSSEPFSAATRLHVGFCGTFAASTIRAVESARSLAAARSFFEFSMSISASASDRMAFTRSEVACANTLACRTISPATGLKVGFLFISPGPSLTLSRALMIPKFHQALSWAGLERNSPCRTCSGLQNARETSASISKARTEALLCLQEAPGSISGSTS